jgi:hypothetical protein
MVLADTSVWIAHFASGNPFSLTSCVMVWSLLIHL